MKPQPLPTWTCKELMCAQLAVNRLKRLPQLALEVFYAAK